MWRITSGCICWLLFEDAGLLASYSTTACLLALELTEHDLCLVSFHLYWGVRGPA
jgi:hypothetical protein